MTSQTPGQALSEIIARALVAELSDQQLGAEAAWHDPEFRDNALRCGQAVLSAIEMWGYAVAPLEPTRDMLIELSYSCMNDGSEASEDLAREGYREMLTARPR